MRARAAIVISLAAILAVTLIPSAEAQPAQTAHGRRVIDDNHFGNPQLGRVRTAIQGEEVTEGTDRLRGATRISKLASPDGRVRALRVQVNRVALQQLLDGTWTDVVIQFTPVNSGTGPSALSKTPFAPLCAGGLARYRVRAVLSVRWTDNFLSVFARNSNQFFRRPNEVIGCP